MCGGLPCGCGAEVGRRIGGCLERTIGALPGGMLGVSLRVRHGGVAQRESTSRVSFDRRRHATRTHLQQAGTNRKHRTIHKQRQRGTERNGTASPSDTYGPRDLGTWQTRQSETLLVSAHTQRESEREHRPRQRYITMSRTHAILPYHAHKGERLHVRSRTRRELGVHRARSRSAPVLVLGTTPGLGPRPPLLDHARAHDAPQPSTRRSS